MPKRLQVPNEYKKIGKSLLRIRKMQVQREALPMQNAHWSLSSVKSYSHDDTKVSWQNFNKEKTYIPSEFPKE